MTIKKEESSKPEASEQQPKAPQSGELDEKQLDKAVGGTGGATSTYGYRAPPPPPPPAP
jgi:hypothetical protein